MRKSPLATGEIYHVFNRSIAGYVILGFPGDCKRISKALEYYRCTRELSLSRYLALQEQGERTKTGSGNPAPTARIIEIIAYCLMPTHIHLVLRQTVDEGISIFMNNILNSYSRYFNIKQKRKGPLWEGRFKNVRVETDEQLMHLTRYVHLNPVTAGIVDKPEEWRYSSYLEYLNEKKGTCVFEELLDMSPNQYRIFTEDRIDYQKKLAVIKHLLLE